MNLLNRLLGAKNPSLVSTKCKLLVQVLAHVYATSSHGFKYIIYMCYIINYILQLVVYKYNYDTCMYNIFYLKWSWRIEKIGYEVLMFIATSKKDEKIGLGRDGFLFSLDAKIDKILKCDVDRRCV